MRQASGPARAGILAVAVIITAGAIWLSAPAQTPRLQPLGDAVMNSAPAVRVSLAGPSAEKTVQPAPQPAPQTDPKPEPEPEPEPQPEPEPEPEPEPRPEPTPKPEPVEQQPEPSTRQDNQETREQANQTGQDTAEKSSDVQQVALTAGNSDAVDNYLTKLSRHLGRYYEYPRRARRLRQEGVPVIVFEFSRSGELIGHSLQDSSGHRLLDDAAIEMLELAAPLPSVPDSMSGESFRYALPVRFQLR